MSTNAKATEWLHFLGARTVQDACSEISRMVQRLDEAYDSINYVLKSVNAAPESEVDDVLRITRKTLHEAIEMLLQARRVIEYSDPDAA